MNAAEQSEAIIKEVKARARLYVKDNFVTPNPTTILLIENAMLIGVSIAMDKQLDKQLEQLEAMSKSWSSA